MSTSKGRTDRITKADLGEVGRYISAIRRMSNRRKCMADMQIWVFDHWQFDKRNHLSYFFSSLGELLNQTSKKGVENEED
uniref:Uncharacterized protein n=1 Tax=Romanomermis culicivorax TaxID=13658 RepID=A0A915JUB4_ROMCU